MNDWLQVFVQVQVQQVQVQVQVQVSEKRELWSHDSLCCWAVGLGVWKLKGVYQS